METLETMDVEKKDEELMLEDQALEPASMSYVDSIKERIRALLGSKQGNFDAWTLLIKEVEETSPVDMQSICLVYDSFLSEFPLCYGYWSRYAGLKVHLCTINDAQEVYEQAVKVASHSVHLWFSYCSFAILSFEDPADVRRLFQRGLSYVDKDYLCHLLWDKYIEFEYSHKQWNQLAHILINTLRFPTRSLHNYYESFKKLVFLLEEDLGIKNGMTTQPEVLPDCQLSHAVVCGYAEISNVANLLDESLLGPETLRKYFSVGEVLYGKSKQLDKCISSFEVRIRRQHFHVKPLDEFQLENWHEYLTFVEDQGNFDWTVKLYERCLIPCANYMEFWIRYVDFVDAKGGREIANYALERAFKVFLKRIPAFHIYYSKFKEKIGDVDGARAPFLHCDEDLTVDAVENVNKRANMEKRMGNIEASLAIYDKAIKMAHEKQNMELLSLLYSNLARFTFVATSSVDATKEVFIKGIRQNPCKSIIEGFLDFMTLHGKDNLVDAVDSTMNAILSPGTDLFQALGSNEREEISHLYLKFVDLCGNIDEISKAWERHIKLFPHFLRRTTVFDYSSNGFLVPCKKSEGISTKSPSRSFENHGKHLVKNCSSIENSKVLKKDLVEDLFEESQNVVQIQDASSENHETGIPICHLKEGSQENLEPPALDNLSINSPNIATQLADPITSHNNCAPQEVTSKKDGNKLKHGDDDVSEAYSNGEKYLKSESNSRAEDCSLTRPASHVPSGTKTDLQLQVQEQSNTIQALPVNFACPQLSTGGIQWAPWHGYVQPSQQQQWHAYTQMQNQYGTNLPMSVCHGYVSQASSLPYTQDPDGGQTQVLYQLASGQAYSNPGLDFLGQHMQQSALNYAQAQQVQQAASQSQTHAYQNVPQSNEQYGYYNNVQGFPPHIWQYYQSLYHLQQQQMQQQQQDQLDNNSQKQQLTVTLQQKGSQKELVENQEEQKQLQIQVSSPQCLINVDQKQNNTQQLQKQLVEQEESVQPNQQSLQGINCEQQQFLYLQQQQQFYHQQQQQHQIYLQQQQLYQQQYQQFVLNQQQLALQFQSQQKQREPQLLILPSQQQQSQYPQHVQSISQQMEIQQQQQQQQTNKLELKALEGNAYSQGLQDSVKGALRSTDSCSSKMLMDSPTQ
ncbi:hypothetical protein HPP92_020285 [Vanilla planifolia]|uniref:Pre-mRNA-processing factor 39 n=1 Tax=Vanilla planifolia TaxID=51239 RepID=A0A835ULX5_VANPL|nr:hypothetical protein HPP92_020285 [Vanilla planifolia]